jgi:hypothetical protein
VLPQLPLKPQVPDRSGGGSQLTSLEIVVMLTFSIGLCVGIIMATERKNRPITRVIGLGLAVGSFAACLGGMIVQSQ